MDSSTFVSACDGEDVFCDVHQGYDCVCHVEQSRLRVMEFPPGMGSDVTEGRREVTGVEVGNPPPVVSRVLLGTVRQGTCHLFQGIEREE